MREAVGGFSQKHLELQSTRWVSKSTSHASYLPVMERFSGKVWDLYARDLEFNTGCDFFQKCFYIKLHSLHSFKSIS